MNDIFISYKREEQPEARKLADALEKERWNVWWDPKLRAGEHFDDVIEKALKDSKCVVVMWSKLSVNSRYVKDEATYALNRNKLVPVKIEEAELPFRFEGLHTPLLIGWDGSREFPDFRRLVDDISVIVKPSEVARQRPRPSKRRLHSAAQSVKKAPTAGTVFRDKLKDGSQGPEMVIVSAGNFKMGDIQGEGGDAEKPVHTVSIPKPFAIGRYQITFDDYDRFASATRRQLPNDQGWGRGRQPAINVSWCDAVEYANWLSEQTGNRYRLPTEAEWEYAARAGTETTHWWGNEIKPAMANFDGPDNGWGGRTTSPVASFQPNPFGLYDTAGNVSEWVEDCWHDNYNDAPSDGPAWMQENGGDCGRRVVRGGSWHAIPVGLRSSNRDRDVTDLRGSNSVFVSPRTWIKRLFQSFKMFKTSKDIGAENMNDETIEILNPTGVRASKRIRLAPRKHDNLGGVRIGLLDNNKPNADKFLDHVGALLKKRYDGVELVAKRKMTRIEADCLKELAERCDVVINAFAD